MTSRSAIRSIDTVNDYAGRDVVASVEEITPTVARKWLHMNRANRPVSQLRVNQYAQQMRLGKWQLNGESIKFTDTDLIDGQHRLLAVVASGVTIKTVVVYALDKEAFVTIDQGKKRTTADMLAVSGKGKYRAEAAATATFLWWADHQGGDPRPRGNVLPPQDELLRIGSSPEVQQAVEITSSTLRQKLGISPGAIGYVYVRTREIDPDACVRFFDRLKTGIAATPGDPVLRVRDLLLTDAARKTRNMTPHEKAAVLIKAWNAFRAGRSVRALAWKSSQEAFPVPV